MPCSLPACTRHHISNICLEQVMEESNNCKVITQSDVQLERSILSPQPQKTHLFGYKTYTYIHTRIYIYTYIYTHTDTHNIRVPQCKHQQALYKLSTCMHAYILWVGVALYIVMLCHQSMLNYHKLLSLLQLIFNTNCPIMYSSLLKASPLPITDVCKA